jgi:hypothetical protein
VAGSCEYGDEPSGSSATELVSWLVGIPLPKHSQSAFVPLHEKSSSAAVTIIALYMFIFSKWHFIIHSQALIVQDGPLASIFSVS